MLGVLGNIIGSPKAALKVLDMGRAALDASVYTAEEKATDAQETRREVAADRAQNRAMIFKHQEVMLGYTAKFMESTQGHNLTRRLIALVSTAMVVVFSVAALGLWLASIWVGEPQATRMVTASAGITEFVKPWWAVFMVVISFYFSGPHIQSGIDALKTKWGGVPNAALTKVENPPKPPKFDGKDGDYS